MKHIANIVTKNKLNLSIYFNIVDTLEDVDLSIPTLIIGWKEVKEWFPEQDILNKKIMDNLFWTFSKREKRFQYENDINLFISYVVEYLNKCVNYRFFNYVLSTQTKQSSFISHLNKGNCYIYYNSRFMYIYDVNNSITLGISLKDINFIGINLKDFLNELNKNNNNVIIENLNFIDKETFSLIKENIKIIPFLNYLKNCDIY